MLPFDIPTSSSNEGPKKFNASERIFIPGARIYSREYRVFGETLKKQGKRERVGMMNRGSWKKTLESLFEIRNESGGKTTENAECESMVLDHHREKSVKRGAAHGKRRLESAVQGYKKINKRLQGSGTKPTYMDTGRNGRVSKGSSRIYNRKEENDDDDDDDDLSMVSMCEDETIESSEESINEDMGISLSELLIVQMSNKPKMRGKLKKEKLELKKRKPSFSPHTKSKKRKTEFAAELMALSDDEEDEETIQNENRKYATNYRNISKMEMAGLKKRKTGFSRRMEKKPKAKAISRRKAMKKRKKIKYDSEDEMSPGKSNCVRSEKATEKKSNKQNMQNENKGGGNANNYNSSNAERKGNAVGDNRNVNSEKTASDEKKAISAVNKGPGHGEITSKVSKENKNDTNKVNKAKEKVEDLSKKVDQKEVEDVDEEVAMAVPKPRVSRYHKPRQQPMKTAGMSSGKPSKKVPPFIKFYMSVYRELCESRSIRTIAKEAAKRWRAMTAEEKNMFYTKKT